MVRKAPSNKNNVVISKHGISNTYRSPIVLTPSHEVEEFCSIFGPNINVVGIKPENPEILHFLTFNSNGALGLSPPSCVLALVSQEQEHMPLLESLRQKLLEVGARTIPAPVLFELDNARTTVRALLAPLSDLFLAQGGMIASQSREIAQLRQRNEQIQNNFYDLELLVDRKQIQPCDLTFESAPFSGGGDGIVSVVSVLFGIAQILPIASKGISSIAFHVDSVGGASDEVDVVLRTLEDDRTVARWSFTGQSLSPGWNILSVGRTLGGLRRTVRLEILAKSSSDGPQLSLGGLQPIERFQISRLSDGAPLLPRNLAIRVWAGLPEVALPMRFAPDLGDQADPHARGPIEIPLPESILRRLRPSEERRQSGEFISIDYIEEEDALLCHPPEYGETVATIEKCLPPGTVRVSAVVYIANELAQPIMFTLRASAAREGNAINGSAAEDVSELIQSEPVVASGGTIKTIDLFLDGSAMPLGANLHLSTRMVTEGNNYYAWARFSKITITVQHAG